jgi:hypothetical protein
MKTELKIKVKGLEQSVSLNNRGIFSTEWLGEEITARSFTELENAVAKLAVDRPSKAKVPAFFVTPFGNQRGHAITMTGIHSTNGDILGRDEEGKAFRNNNRGLFLQLTEAEEQEYGILCGNVELATVKLKEFQKQHQIDPVDAIRTKLKGNTS